MKKRLLAWLLAFSMMLSLVPVNAFALGTEDGEVTVPTEAAQTESAETAAPAAESESDAFDTAAILEDTELPVEEYAEQAEPVYTIEFQKNELSADHLSVDEQFANQFSFAVSEDVSFETFKATFRYNPAVAMFGMLSPTDFAVEQDTEAGILTLSDRNNSFTAGETYAYQLLFAAAELGDAAVALESFQVDGKELLSKRVTVAQTVGYSVTWTENAAYTVTGEKNAPVNDSYTFAVAANAGYDAANMVVKANGSEVTGTDGRYTVNTVASDLTITVEGVTETVQAAAGLSALKFGDASTESKAAIYELSPAFNPAVKAYTLLIPDSASSFYAWASRANDRSSGTTITAKWVSLSNNTEKPRC